MRNGNLAVLTILGFLEQLPIEGMGALNAESRYVTQKGSASLHLLCWEEHSFNDFIIRNNVFTSTRNMAKALIAAQVLGWVFVNLLSFYKFFCVCLA